MSTITGFDDKTHGWSKAIVQKMGGVKIADAFLRGEYELKPVMQAPEGMFDSKKYFTIRDGLYVFPEFTRQIVLAYQHLILKRGIEDVDHVDLYSNMDDCEIIAKCLGGDEEARKHSFTPDQFADLIDAQRGGTSGVLVS